MLHTGIVPDYFSGGVLTPVPKSGKDPTVLDNYRGVIVQLIVDCRKLVPDVLPDNSETLNIIENKTRLLCYKLHLKRLYLCKINKEVSTTSMAADPPPIQYT